MKRVNHGVIVSLISCSSVGWTKELIHVECQLAEAECPWTVMLSFWNVIFSIMCEFTSEIIDSDSTKEYKERYY